MEAVLDIWRHTSEVASSHVLPHGFQDLIGAQSSGEAPCWFLAPPL